MSDEQPITPQDREWISVAPPQPSNGEATAPRGRGLAVSAMTIGLAALLTAVVSALYFSVFTLLAALLGLVAIGLGIAALVRRQTPRPASVTGLVSGVLAVVLAVVAGALMLGALLGNAAAGPEAGSGSGSGSASSTQDDGWTPGSEAEALLDWPANYGTGGVLFASGTAGPEPVPSAPITPGTAPQPTTPTRSTGPADILLHVDYRCPHCVEFETVNAEELERVVQSGAATLELRPLAFVTPFSTQLSGALACVVDAEPAFAWAAHRALLAPANQEISDSTELAAAIGGLGGPTRECIASGRFTSFADELSDWYSRNPVPHAVDPGLRVQGTPLAVVNGVPYTGQPSDGAAFAAFLAEQGL